MDEPPILLSAKLNEVVSPISSFVSDRKNWMPIGLGLLINIIHWILVLGNVRLGATPIVLHYNVVYGADLVASERWLYLLPAAAAVFLAGNVWLARYFFHREKIAAYFLNGGSLAVQLIILAATLSLIAINEL